MEQPRKPGGRRPGAGRPRSIETRVVRLPLPVAELAKRWMERGIRAGDVNAFLDVSAIRQASIPLVNSTASSGFPSPADDYLDRPLDFNELLVHNPSATFAVKVSGESMIKAGIFPGDIAVVDRSRDVSNGCIVLACLDNEFTIKRYLVRAGRIALHPENPAFPDIEIEDDVEFEVWGVVTNSIRMF